MRHAHFVAHHSTERQGDSFPEEEVRADQRKASALTKSFEAMTRVSQRRAGVVWPLARLGDESEPANRNPTLEL